MGNAILRTPPYKPGLAPSHFTFMSENLQQWVDIIYGKLFLEECIFKSASIKLMSGPCKVKRLMEKVEIK